MQEIFLLKKFSLLNELKKPKACPQKVLDFSVDLCQCVAKNQRLFTQIFSINPTSFVFRLYAGYVQKIICNSSVASAATGE